MRTTLTIIASVLTLLQVSGQDTTFTSHRNAVALEVTGLIPMSYGELGSGTAVYPYFLTYRRSLGMGWVRSGIGAYGWSEHSNGDVNSSALIRDRSSWRVNARLGYAIPLVDERRWLVLAGLDALYVRTNSESRDVWEDNSETKSKYSTTGMGIGLALDAQFRISKRMALGTEFNLELIRSKSTEDRSYSDSPEDDRHATSERTGIDAIRAFSLFLLAYF